MCKKFEFNIGDNVWLMYNNSAVCGTIKSMHYKKIASVDRETVVESEKCYVDFDGKSIGYYEINCLFRTKEDLIKSL